MGAGKGHSAESMTFVLLLFQQFSLRHSHMRLTHVSRNGCENEEEEEKDEGRFQEEWVEWVLGAQSKPQIDIISTFSSLFWQETAKMEAVCRANMETGQQLTP